MREYHLIDNTHNRTAIVNLCTCELAAKLRLYTGSKFSEEDVEKLWELKYHPPAYDTINQKIRIPNIKWYINTHSKELTMYPEWNPDFLMGMLEWGKITKFRRNFYSFSWFGNYDLLQAIQLSPFTGKLNTQVAIKSMYEYNWTCVPALCFNYSKDSIEYLAGVLSTGIIVNEKGKTLVKYNRKVGKLIGDFGIPIEIQNRYAFISVFWPAVLQKHMPKALQLKWGGIKDEKAYRANEYATITWKIYTGEDSRVNAMPYLMSRRTAYYKYGTVKNLREMWIKNQMIGLDSRFKSVIQEWQKDSKEIV